MARVSKGATQCKDGAEQGVDTVSEAGRHGDMAYLLNALSRTVSVTSGRLAVVDLQGWRFVRSLRSG